MSTAQFMPRIGSLEHRRLRLLMLALLVFAITMLIPQLALAKFDGSFSPDSAMVENVNTSLTAWWKSIAIWGMWISLAALIISILFFGGRFWWIPIATCLIFLFGESFINGVKGLMG